MSVECFFAEILAIQYTAHQKSNLHIPLKNDD